MLYLAEVILLVLWVRILGFGWLALRFHFGAAGPRAAATDDCDVSVVIPAFQEESQIGQTLLSVGQLRPTPREVIVVDDGSTDRTAEIAARYLSGIGNGRLVRLPGNRGKAGALNMGISLAQASTVLTLDADTRLDPQALGIAVARLQQTGADSIAFDLRVERPGTLLAQLQSQEYAGSLNFERAGQSWAGLISILPGAATLFRRDALTEVPFASRTLTEDADLTLAFARSGRPMVMESRAIAYTDAPRGLCALLHQRARWAAGHLQCCWHHATTGASTTAPGALTVLNFLVGTLSPLLALIALASLAIGGAGPVTSLGWFGATAVSAAVVYIQRLLARSVRQFGTRSVPVFTAEPIFSGVIGGMAIYLALARLVGTTGRRRERGIEPLSVNSSLTCRKISCSWCEYQELGKVDLSDLNGGRHDAPAETGGGTWRSIRGHGSDAGYG